MVESFQFDVYKDELGDILFPGPSMLSREEAVFYHFLGRHFYTGEGSVVDAGCWLGSSSFYIAKGIEQGNLMGNRGKILSFDLFLWENSHHLTKESKKLNLQDGDNFRELTKGYLSSIKVQHEVNQIDYSIQPDLLSYYSEDKPVEVLLIDAGKSPDLLLNILEGYLPFAIEDRTLVFFQDYRDYFCWFTPAIVEMLRDVLRPAKFLSAGGAAFIVKDINRVSYCIAQAREAFKSNEAEVFRSYDQATNAMKQANPHAFFQMKANRVALSLHFCGVTEAYFGPASQRRISIDDTETSKGLLRYIRQLDREWSFKVIDTPLENAYRRVIHGINGHKDLTIPWRSISYYRRRVMNPSYWRRALVNAAKRRGWIYELLKDLRKRFA